MIHKIWNRTGAFGLLAATFGIFSAEASLPRRGTIQRIEPPALEREIESTIQLPARALRFQHSWYQYWPSRLLEQWALKRTFDVYRLEFSVLNENRTHSVFRVECAVIDWTSDEYLLISECQIRTERGSRLSREDHSALPARLARILLPHHYWMVLYSELNL